MNKPKQMGDGRTPERLAAHYAVEAELADRLRRSTKSDRMRLYSTVYDELFRRVPDHPQLTRRKSKEAQAQAIATHVRLLRRYLRPSDVFMELGAGDCSLSLEVSRVVKQTYAVDVSAEITRHVRCPENMSVIVSDGSTIAVPPGSVNVAFSHQLIEHMHVDDAIEHVRNVGQALVDGGIYICITPNALNGPHDISKHFTDTATGFHMKEYTTSDLMDLFASAGFASLHPLVGVKGAFGAAPPALIRAVESALGRLPRPVGRRLAGRAPFWQLLGITLLARKSAKQH